MNVDRTVKNVVTSARDFVEQLVPADSTDPAAREARKRLEGVLKELNPAGGKTVSADAQKAKKGGKKAKRQAEKAAKAGKQ